MKTGTAIRLITLFLGILCAFLVAGTLSDILLRWSGLEGPAALVLSIVAFAAIFFSVLRILGRFAGIQIFPSGPE